MSVLEAEGYEFESHCPDIVLSITQWFRVIVCDSIGRGFKSHCLPFENFFKAYSLSG